MGQNGVSSGRVNAVAMSSATSAASVDVARRIVASVVTRETVRSTAWPS